MTSFGHIITSLLPQPHCQALPLVVTVDVQSGGGQRHSPSTEELLKSEEKAIQVINSVCTTVYLCSPEPPKLLRFYVLPNYASF